MQNYIASIARLPSFTIQDNSTWAIPMRAAQAA